MKKNTLKFISQNDDIWLKDELMNHISKKFYKNLKFMKATFLVNDIEYPTYKNVKKGDVITIEYFKEEQIIDWPIYESKLEIHYEDENYLVVNKRAGLLTIPTKAEEFSLYQEALYYLKSTNQDLNVSILNRLDKDTKGLVVIAKNRLAANYLQPTHEKMVRKYKCLCHGKFDNDNGTIKNYIDKHEDSHKRFISLDKGKIAISNYYVLKRNSDSTLVEFILETGRTHQIRLHAASLGNPIIGDTMYGKDTVADLHLCSYHVSFINPFTKEKVICEIESGWE